MCRYYVRFIHMYLKAYVYLSLLGGPVVEGVGFEFTSYDHVPKYF